MKLYTGCVEDRNDPLQLGRCRVRIVGLHTENKISLSTEDLPWAYPIMPVTSAGTSGIGSAPLGPVEGTWVLITFMDPDEQMPMMLGTMIGAYQTPESLETGVFAVDKVDPDGTIDISSSKTIPQNADGTPGTPPAPAGTPPATQPTGAAATGETFGKVINNKDQIVGPLAVLVAKAESGAEGYNAFNRGTANGKIIPAGKKMDLTKMPIKDIMAAQALPPGDPNRLFAVGKYQTIPITLKAACQSLNIDINQPFSEQTQDIICQEYLVAKKRPPLVAYYKNPDKNNENLLKAAGASLAAEFASIEDPNFLGFPYGGPNGSYYKSGNRAKTTFAQIKSTLQSEWDFRNNKSSPPPTASIADNDKVAKGTDFSGVSKAVPIDDSVATPAKPSVAAASSPAPSVVPDVVPPLPTSLTSLQSQLPAIPGLDSSLSDVFGGLDKDLLAGIVAAQAAIKDLVSSIDLSGPLSALDELKSGASEVLGGFGSTLSEVAGNLGIPNDSGSVTELAANLGLYNAKPEDVVGELTKIAGSQQGQAKAMLAKLGTEPSKPSVAAVGQKNPDGSISNGTGVNPAVGFQDPNGKYPLYKNEPDTNRLATGNNLGRTVVLKKEAALKTGIPIANGGTWDQSPNPYNTTYPFNKVTQTESGHIQEWDDTPGSERIHTYHKSGTFSEIDANGTQVNRIVGDGFEIMERNGHVYVHGAYCVSVDGAMNLRTDNVFNLEVSGAANINIYNNANINVSGDANLAVGSTLNAKASKINMESTGQFNIKAGTGLNIQAGSDINVKSDSTITTQAEGNFNLKVAGGIFSEAANDINHKAGGVFNAESAEATNIKSGDSVSISSGADMNIKSAAEGNFESAGKFSVQAGGNFAVDAAIIDLQNGGSSSASEADGAEGSVDAKEANIAEVELPVETRGTSGVDRLPPLAVVNRGSEVGLDQPNTGDFGTYRTRRVENNQTQSTSVAATTYEKQEEKPTKSSASTPGPVAGLDQIRNMTADQYQAGMKLSKHFTLGDLTKGGVRIPRVTYTDGRGVKNTPQQIVANLANLCVNALDPIREKFGDFKITSGFRRTPYGAALGDLGVDKNGKPIVESGDHASGSAADIVFPGGKLETYKNCVEIAKMLPAWAQIIMEYDGNAFWIHVAVRQSNNPGHTFTMVSHRLLKPGNVTHGFVLV